MSHEIEITCIDSLLQADMEMESWDAWDTSQSQQAQAQYNQANSAYYQNAGRSGGMRSQSANHYMRGRKPEPEAEPEPEPDYFQGMVPEVKRPAKASDWTVSRFERKRLTVLTLTLLSEPW